MVPVLLEARIGSCRLELDFGKSCHKNQARVAFLSIARKEQPKTFAATLRVVLVWLSSLEGLPTLRVCLSRCIPLGYSI